MLVQFDVARGIVRVSSRVFELHQYPPIRTMFRYCIRGIKARLKMTYQEAQPVCGVTKVRDASSLRPRTTKPGYAEKIIEAGLTTLVRVH